MKIRLISKTQVDSSFVGDTDLDFLDNPEALMIWIARVSSKKQNNPKYAKLLKYCIDNAHWSVFEMIDATFEIETSMSIGEQILRHRSFCFQKFSARYQKLDSGYELINARKQAKNNRQSSKDELNDVDKIWFNEVQEKVDKLTRKYYNEALDRGIARECARFVLPANTTTRFFMKGSIRSWIHYIQVRADEHTQLEHREIAIEIRNILSKHFPTIAEAMGWNNESQDSL